MWKFIKAEWRYWLKSPMTWILFFINALLVFGAVYSDSIVIGGGVGNVHKNAPHVIQTYYGLMASLIGLLMTTAYMNATANRDFQYQMYQLVFSSPIKKRDYFFGKFIGAYTMALIPVLGVSLGSIVAPLMPGLEPERYGPIIWEGHVMGLLGFAIPNVFIAGVLLFSLAIIFRSSIVSFIGSMVMLILYAISSGFTRDIHKEWLANLLDPFGFRPEGLISKYATVSEQNLHATPLTGAFLVNRIVWVGIAAVALFIMYWRFSFNTKNSKGRRKEVLKPENMYVPTGKSFIPGSVNKMSLNLFFNLVVFEVKTIIRNPTFIIIAAIGAINLITNLTSFTGSYGAAQYPVTYHVVEAIQGGFYVFIIAIITFYSGVLVWKERDAKINEIQDATPVRTGMLFSSKFFALVITIGVILSLTIVIGVIAQFCYGYHRFEIGLYIKYLLGLDLLGFSYLIIIALFFHYLINNRYIAYFAFIAFLVCNAFIWGALEIKSNMVKYNAFPNLIYSDMNGFGPFVKGQVWFGLYWGLCATIIGLIVFAFYIRGKEYGFRHRWNDAMASMKKNMGVIILAVVLFIGCSGFVYYNTQVLNKYDSTKESEKVSIDYEKAYKKYESKPQPRYYNLNYKIDLRPQERSMSVSIVAWAHNISKEAISELYLTLPSEIDSINIHIDNATEKVHDKRLHFRVFSLKQPLLTGDSIQLNFSFKKENPGFENEVSFTQLTQNGTFFNSFDVLPVIGYNKQYELEDKNKRIKFKLPKRERLPKLDENNLAVRSNNYISTDADWVSVNTVISTDADQVAIAPGSLRKTWDENGRKYFNYALDKQSLNFYSFLSGKYEVARRKWNGIDIEVYYDKRHAVNVPNMLNSVQKSLTYYTANFGPYYHKQCRIIEFPRYAGFAQAFPGTMPYSESIGFITDLRDVTKDDIDFVFYVVAHEMGHQYWAHQLIGAGMQGSEMMSEGFAQYSALMVMEKEYGKDKMKKFLKYEMDGYLRGRSNELEAERPIIRTENQQYIHYQKASVVLYYLKEMIGEDKVNMAMKSLIDTFGYKNPPYPTSMSALRAFKAVTPDSLQYLITDMFENITLFSNRVMEASSKKIGDEYEVTFKTSSEKFRSDSLGKETAMPINDYVDIGVFAAPKHKNSVGKALVLNRIKVDKKSNTYTFKVKEKPYQVGIDPYNYLIDRIPDDNLKTVD